MKAAVLTLVVGLCGGCHHDATPPDEVLDFSGIGVDQSAIVDEDGGHPDGGASTDGGVACDPAAALDGGSAVGSWIVKGGCATAEAFYQLTGTCSGITYDSIEIVASSGGAPTGTLALFSTDTFSRSLDAQLTAQAFVPGACLSNGCSAYATTTHEQFGWLTISCSPQGDGCLCPLSVDIGIVSESGQWSPTAAGFTLSPTAGVPQSFVTGVSADDDVLVVRGDEASLRGSRGVTLVLGK